MTLLSAVHTLLAMLGLAGFAFIAWQRPRHGLYLIAAGLPLYLVRLTIFSIPTTVLELAILILFTVWLLKDKKWKRLNVRFISSRHTPATNRILIDYRLGLTLLLASAVSATLISPNTLQALGILKAYFIEPVMVLLVFAYEIKNLRQIRALMAMLGIPVIVIGVVAAWQYATGMGIPNPFWAAEATRRATTFFGYPNANALLVAPIVALYGGLLWNRDGLIARIYAIAVITMGVVIIIAVKSAGAAAALVAVLFLMLVRARVTRVVAVALAVIAISLTLHSLPVHERSQEILKNISLNYLDLNSTSLEIRINQWRETAALLRDTPFFGAGLAGYQTALKPYHTYDFLEIYLYPHNILLNAWVELGIAGLAAFLLLILAVARSLARGIKKSASKHLAWAVLFAWVAILIHGMVDVPYFKNDLSVLWMIFVGFALYSGSSKSGAG